jgi:hypothetical protein
VKIKNENFFPKIDYNNVVIVISAVLAHGLLLLNDGVYWDGWLIYDIFLEKDWNDYYLWATEMGDLPIMSYFYWLLVKIFPGVIFGYKLVAFLSITFSALFVYMICNELRLTNRIENLFIALLSLSYPAYQVSVELCVNTYSVCYSLFLLACLLAVKSERKERISHYFLRLCSLALFILSFRVNSLLVFYFGFFFILVFYIRRSWRFFSVRDAFAKIIPRRIDYLILPFLYWVIKKVCFPSHGGYSGYNQPGGFDLLQIIYNFIMFLKNAVYAQLNGALVNLINMPVLLLLCLFATYYIYLTYSLDDKVFFKQKLRPYSLLFFGFLLLTLGIFPYVAVGKVPLISGWRTRHALLIALPMAIIIVSFGRLFFSNKKGSISKIGFSFFVILLLAFSLSSITYYISWQARWIKDRSVMTNLSALNMKGDISIFWIKDQFPVGGENYYRFYEWSTMFKTVWGDESYIGLDQKKYSAVSLAGYQRFFNKRYNLSDFDPDGRQATLTIHRGVLQYSDLELSIRYLYYKWLRKTGLTKYLSMVTDIEIQPIPVPQ